MSDVDEYPFSAHAAGECAWESTGCNGWRVKIGIAGLVRVLRLALDSEAAVDEAAASKNRKMDLDCGTWLQLEVSGVYFRCLEARAKEVLVERWWELALKVAEDVLCCAG
jgi:hypothetical protein